MNSPAFGRRIAEIAAEEGIKFARSILEKLALMALDQATAERPLWMPPGKTVESFVAVLTGTAAPMVRGALLDRLFPAQERRAATNFCNGLAVREQEIYLAAAHRRLRVERESCTAEQVYALFLFLCNQRRLHDGGEVH